MKTSFFSKITIFFLSVSFFLNATPMFAQLQTKSNSVTTKVGNPAAGSAVTPDGIHACPVKATYVRFTTYPNIQQGNYSFVCGHCRPIFNANDVGVGSQGGTPVVAVVNGKADDISNPVGGPAVWLAGDDGRNYYYAHLKRDRIVAGRVAAGQVIGYIAAANDAAAKNNGTAHVHFSAGTPGNQHTFNDPANIPAGPLLDSWCSISVCGGKPNSAYACGG